ncbi:MAG TPA: hypothetical protein VK539_08620 [Myxococcaceae bacterium]|nr:hypothetical protein [Myxococcaceae bacterium]
MPPEPGPTPKKQTSPWLYVAIGCGGLVVLGGLAIAAGALFVFKKSDELNQDLANPVARAEKVKRALGARALPEGYHAIMTVSMPMLMDTTVISTRDAAPSRRTFMYVRFKVITPRDAQGMRDYLEGRTDDASVFARSRLQMKTEQLVGRGQLELQNGQKLLYLAQRGELRFGGNSKSEGPGLNALVLFECPTQSDVRMGIWTAPDTSPEVPLEQLELQGTPVDPEAIRSFMSHFNPCQVN